MTYLVIGVSLVLLVFLHELGHFSVALAVGMRPRSFYVGFPPALAKIKRNGIEYGIGMIPLGGLVRIPGMHRPAARDLQALFEPAMRERPELAPPVGFVRRALAAEDYDAARSGSLELESEVAAAQLSPTARRAAQRALRDVEEGTAPDAYWRAPTWKRVSVIAAGPLANILIAFLILFAVFSISGAPSQHPTNQVDQVQPGSPAAAAGLQAGDRIVAVDGHPTRSFADVSHLLRSSHGRKVTLIVNRDGRRVRVGPRRTIRRDGRWIFGFGPATTLVHYTPGRAASAAGSYMWGVVRNTGVGLKSLFSSQGRSQLSGPVGITGVLHSQLKVGWTWYFLILAFVSMSLALLNLLPVLPLDGGHIVFSLIEGIRGRALAREVYERVSVVGVAFILLIMVIASSNDLSSLGH